MNSLELISQQRQKEGRFLKVFLASSLMGSLVLHASSMTMRVGNFWSDLSNVLPTVVAEDEIEVTVIENSPEKPIPEALTEESPSELDIHQKVAFVPDLAPPPIAPEPQAPLPTGVDAPAPLHPVTIP